MKRTFNRILCLVLVLSLGFMISVAAPAAADDPVDGTIWEPGKEDPEPTKPTPKPDPNPPSILFPDKDTTLKVEFNGGNEDEGWLDVDPDALEEDGDYVIRVEKDALIPEEEVPETVTADAYYDFLGWVLEDDYKAGKYTEIVDLDTYAVEEPIKLVAVYLDTWTPYRDMKADRSDWFYKYVRDLSIGGVVNGTPDGDFLPTTPLAYGEALKLIMLATGYDVQVATDTHWASGYYTLALKDGLCDVEGIDLQSSITRREIAEIIVRALDLPDPESDSPFADTDLAVAIALYEANLMIGTTDDNGDTVFMPDNDITRAEISTVVWRIYKYYAELTA